MIKEAQCAAAGPRLGDGAATMHQAAGHWLACSAYSSDRGHPAARFVGPAQKALVSKINSANGAFYSQTKMVFFASEHPFLFLTFLSPAWLLGLPGIIELRVR